MSTMHKDLFAVGRRNHDAAVRLMRELQDVQAEYPDEVLPLDAIRVLSSVWPFLQAYGRRDHRGLVDEDIDDPLAPWAPSDDEGKP